MTTIRQDSRFRKQLGHKLDYCLNGITFRWPNSTLESHPRKDTHFFAPSPAMALDTGSPVASPAPVPSHPVFGSLPGRGLLGSRERCSRLLLRRTGTAQRRLCCLIRSAALVAGDTSAGAGVRSVHHLFRGRRLPPPAVGQVLHLAGRGVAWCYASPRSSGDSAQRLLLVLPLPAAAMVALGASFLIRLRRQRHSMMPLRRGHGRRGRHARQRAQELHDRSQPGPAVHAGGRRRAALPRRRRAVGRGSAGRGRHCRAADPGAGARVGAGAVGRGAVDQRGRAGGSSRQDKDSYPQAIRCPPGLGLGTVVLSPLLAQLTRRQLSSVASNGSVPAKEDENLSAEIRKLNVTSGDSTVKQDDGRWRGKGKLPTAIRESLEAPPSLIQRHIRSAPDVRSSVATQGLPMEQHV